MNASTSPTHHLVFAGSYATADQPGIHVFSYDDSTGALTAQSQFAGITNPSFLVVHPNRRWLYAVGETSRQDGQPAGTVWALRFDRASWAIQTANHVNSGGDAPCHLALDSTGRWLIVSNYGSGSAGVLRVSDDGSLGAMADFVQHEGAGPNLARQDGPHVHSATFTPDERFVIVADLGIDRLVVYRFDAAAGKLSPHGHGAARPGAGPRHVAFHPAGALAYVANELDSTVTVFDYEAAGGALRERQTVDTLPPGAPENYVADIHFGPSRRYLYVSNRGHDSLAVFEVAADGRLARRGAPSCGGRWPRNFAVAPGGRFVLAANEHSGEVAVLPLSDGGAEVGPPLARVNAPSATFVQISPDPR